MKFVVVFDLDGTLVDSVELHAKAFKFAIKSLGYKNIEKLYKKYKKLTGIPSEEIIKILIPNISSNEIKKIRLLKDKYFVKNIGKIREKKKVINILKELKQKNIKIALFTSSSKKIAKMILKKFKLEKYFDYLVCREDVKNPKPNEEGLIKIMNKFKTKNLVFIGDSKYDKLAAKNAKIKFLNVKELNKEKIYKILGID
ncbi:MAG: HAD-IA family hydrolase [Candidatus Aenigmatarchaeota archaeon]|nr:HAD family hydrolase [Candidatus Aenigmarchaeota archaeon]